MSTATLKVTKPSERHIVLTRVFDAPRHLVFAALTKPDVIRRWLGSKGYSLVVCEVDLRVGGTWHYVLRDPDGSEFGMGGVYREIVPSELLVSTEAFDDYPGETLVTIRLIENGGRTTFTNALLYPSQQIRDAVIESGMVHGAAEAYDKLAEELLSTSSSS